MNLDLENILLSKTVNPILRRIVQRIDRYCPEDGSLLINSLRIFLGEDVELCDRCRRLCEGLAIPFYELGSRALHVDKDFMRKRFIEDKYGEAWFKGFALMMRGIGK